MSSPFSDPVDLGRVANYWVRDPTDDEISTHKRLTDELTRLEAAWIDPYFKKEP